MNLGQIDSEQVTPIRLRFFPFFLTIVPIQMVRLAPLATSVRSLQAAWSEAIASINRSHPFFYRPNAYVPLYAKILS